jgi:hypothetical protein
MKRKDDLIFLILFIFIHLKIIFNFEIKQIPNQSKLISLFSDSSNNQYFFTLTSIGKVLSSGTYQIISNTVNFNEYSKAYFANSVKTHFAVSCSSNNIIEIYDSNGNLIDYRTYSTFSLSEPNLICSIDYDFTTNKIYLGYSYYNSYDLYIYYTVIVFIMDDNGFISDYVSTQFSHETDFTSLDQIYNQAINCAVLRQPLCFVKRKEDISYSVFEDNDVLKYNSVIKIIVSHYKVEYINYDNTEMTLFEYRSDGIYAKTYFGYKEFLSARYIYSYYVINETVFHGSQILYNKTPVSLFISYRSGTYLVLDYTQLSSRNYYDTTTTDVYYIKNNIGYSQVMVSSSLDNNFFIMTRGESEPTTLEYFFYTYKQFECTPYTAKAYSKELITIQLSNLINSYDVTKNIASFKPSTTLARINNNEEVELLENNLDYGVISFNILFQTKGSDYNQTFLSENCFLSIQVCNDRCSKCETNTFSLTGTPTHCTSKMCLDTYYYDLLLKYFLICGEMKCCKSYELNTHQLFRTYLDNTSCAEHTSAFINKNGNTVELVECEFYGYIRIWNFRSGDLIKKIEVCKRIPLVSMCLWNKNYLLASCVDYTIKLIDFKNYAFIKSFNGHNNEVSTIKKIMHPTYGECLISQGLANEQIKMWINS